MEQEKYYIGTDLKFALDITGEGFSMDDDDYEIELSCGNKKVPVSKQEVIDASDEDGYYLLVDSSKFPSGTLHMVVTAYVPDNSFKTKVRREVMSMDLCYLNRP